MSIVLPQPTPPNMYSPFVAGRCPRGPAAPCSPDCALSKLLMPSNLHGNGSDWTSRRRQVLKCITTERASKHNSQEMPA
jgi:hypothetical protein